MTQNVFDNEYRLGAGCKSVMTLRERLTVLR